MGISRSGPGDDAAVTYASLSAPYRETPPSPGIRGFWQVLGRVPGTRASPPPATESHHQFEFCLLLSSNVELIIDNLETVQRWRAGGCRRPARNLSWNISHWGRTADQR
jgi:hypothetical protein